MDETTKIYADDSQYTNTDVEIFDADEDIPDDSPPSAEESMRYYGVDFDVTGLVRRLNNKDLVVPSFDPSYTEGKTGVEGFQRRFVWPKKQMDRFIESLLLGYPVPGIFLVERPNRRFLVLDGQQRLRTLQAFYEGIYNNESKKSVFTLENVGELFRHKTYKDLSEADRRLLDSSVLQTTVVVPREDNLESIYRVFERINSSGVKLQPHEIRVALFNGELINLIRELNTTPSWRSLFGNQSPRLKDHELILRYLMLTELADILYNNNWDKDAIRKSGDDPDSFRYSGMASSLNSYLAKHRNLEGLDKEKIKQEFLTATDAILAGPGKDALRPRGAQINAAHTDALLVGTTLALRKSNDISPAKTTEINQKLLEDTEYTKSIYESTGHFENVIKRLQTSVQLFTS